MTFSVKQAQVALLIKKRRKLKKMKQKDLAKLVGVTAAYISVIEKGERYISMDVANKLAEALELPITDLQPIIGKEQKLLMQQNIQDLSNETRSIADELERIRKLLQPISDDNEKMIDQALCELAAKLRI